MDWSEVGIALLVGAVVVGVYELVRGRNTTAAPPQASVPQTTSGGSNLASTIVTEAGTALNTALKGIFGG